ncbi:MAG: Smr/MutS family protein [Alphaproteobacteria bacterium]|nr:Smr/MutS family protein [Alphaproteobacteria bacterium]
MKPRRPSRPAHATEDEKRLFATVMRDAVPVKRRAKLIHPAKPAAKPEPVPPPPPPVPPPPAAAKRGRAGPVAAPPKPNPGLDRGTEKRLKAGDIPIERRIDLHGMTQAAAHAALDRFVRQAARDGLRLLLVITGKGSASEGVLRRAVPRWLNSGEHAATVLRTAPAQARHGGEGALYVLMRRRRP